MLPIRAIFISVPWKNQFIKTSKFCLENLPKEFDVLIAHCLAADGAKGC